MGRKSHIALPKGRIAEFCKQRHIRKLSLFGSYLHGDFGKLGTLPIYAKIKSASLIKGDATL